MSWVAVAIGGAAVIGAGVGIYASGQSSEATEEAAASSSAATTTASKEASAATLAAARESIALQKEMFYQTREDLAPWRKAGESALNTLTARVNAGPGEFTTSPGYEFRMAEGNKAIERSAAARGGLLSGRTAKALTRYSQDYATGEYDNFLRRYYESLNPLQSLAGVGQTTATSVGAAGQNMANAAANTNMNAANVVGANTINAGNIAGQNALIAGNAQAGGAINTANAITGNLNSGINNYLMWKYLNAPKT